MIADSTKNKTDGDGEKDKIAKDCGLLRGNPFYQTQLQSITSTTTPYAQPTPSSPETVPSLQTWPKKMRFKMGNIISHPVRELVYSSFCVKKITHVAIPVRYTTPQTEQKNFFYLTPF